MSFINALRFLTIFRARQREVMPEDLGRSTAYFPLVGLILGLILAGSYWLLRLVLLPSIISALIILGIAVLSGGLHLDGYVDTFDGIGGHKSVEARWQAMHDKRTGAFGIVALVFLLLIKYTALNSIPEGQMMLALIVMPVLSRWSMVYALVAYPYARPTGLGKVFKEGTGWQRFAVATLIMLAVDIPLFRLAGIVIILGVWVTVLIMATYLKRKFGGLTGDTYGAINEVTEVTVIIMVSIISNTNWFFSTQFTEMILRI